MWEFIQGIWGTVTAALGLAKQRDAELNDPKQKQNLDAARQQEAVDAERKDLAQGIKTGAAADLEKIRKDNA